MTLRTKMLRAATAFTFLGLNPREVERYTFTLIDVAEEELQALAKERGRLRSALKVCEEALHRTDVIRHAENVELLEKAQQASGAWASDWKPDQ